MHIVLQEIRICCPASNTRYFRLYSTKYITCETSYEEIEALLRAIEVRPAFIKELSTQRILKQDKTKRSIQIKIAFTPQWKPSIKKHKLSKEETEQVEAFIAQLELMLEQLGTAPVPSR